MQALRTAQAALGKGCLASSFICVYLFTGELYPTEIRWVCRVRQWSTYPKPGTPGSPGEHLPRQVPSLFLLCPSPPHSQLSGQSGPWPLTCPPSSDRQMGMGFTSINARIGGLAAPLVTVVGEFSAILPPVAFGATSILAGLAVCFLAETRNTPLVETIEAMERR